MDLERIAAYYVAGILGILVDHVTDAMRVVQGTGGREYVLDDKGRATPILCGSIVEWRTEDGVSDGRCGHYATDRGACGFHAAERDAWLDLSPAEQQAIERIEDERMAYGRF